MSASAFYVVELQMANGSNLFSFRVPASALKPTLETATALLLEVAPSLGRGDPVRLVVLAS